jgi:hypothetical protein
VNARAAVAGLAGGGGGAGGGGSAARVSVARVQRLRSVLGPVRRLVRLKP